MKLKSLLTKLDSNTWIDLIFYNSAGIDKTMVGYPKKLMTDKVPQRALYWPVKTIRTNKYAIQIMVWSKDKTVFLSA